MNILLELLLQQSSINLFCDFESHTHLQTPAATRRSVFAPKPRDDLVACKHCQRNFAEDRVRLWWQWWWWDYDDNEDDEIMMTMMMMMVAMMTIMFITTSINIKWSFSSWYISGWETWRDLPEDRAEKEEGFWHDQSAGQGGQKFLYLYFCICLRLLIRH